MTINRLHLPVYSTNLFPHMGILVLLLSTLCLCNPPTRFRRIATLYDPAFFLLNTKSISFKESSFKTAEKPYTDLHYRDILQNHQLYTDILCQYLFKEKTTTRLDDKEKSLNLWTQTYYFNHGITVKKQISNKLYMDTNRYLAAIGGVYEGHVKRTGTPFFNNFYPFYKVTHHCDASLSIEHQKNFVPLYDQFVSDKTNHFKMVGQNGALAADLSITIGIGREVDYWPFYQGLNLERSLLKKNIADFSFSDATILALMDYLAWHQSYRENTIEAQKRIAFQLDSLLNHDESISRKNMKYITPLELTNFFSNRQIELKAGFSSQLVTALRVNGSLKRRSATFPYRIPPQSFTQLGRGNGFLLYNGCTLYQGYPINNWAFLGIKAVKSFFFYSSKTKTWLYPKHNTREILDTRWEMQCYLFLTSWVYIQGSILNLPAWLCVPRAVPGHGTASGNLIINNRLLFTLAGAISDKKESYPAYSFYEESDDTFLPALRISLQIFYSL